MTMEMQQYSTMYIARCRSSHDNVINCHTLITNSLNLTSEKLQMKEKIRELESFP
jgi:hypothetical protein